MSRLDKVYVWLAFEGVPTRCVVLMPDEKAGFNIYAARKIFVGVVVFSRVLHLKSVDDAFVEITRAD